MLQHLAHGVPVQAKLSGDLPNTLTLHHHRPANPKIYVHLVHPSHHPWGRLQPYGRWRAVQFSTAECQSVNPPTWSTLSPPITAHFRADAELRGKWVLKGQPALVDSTSPRYGEKASYYSAVCLETGEVEWMELEGNSNNGTSVAFLEQLREKHPGPLQVIWDNAPAHRGEAVREYLRTPGLDLRLVNPRLHEGRLCRGTARTSTPMRRSGAGRERRRRAISAWAAGRRCRKGSATSWPD